MSDKDESCHCCYGCVIVSDCPYSFSNSRLQLQHADTIILNHRQQFLTPRQPSLTS